MNLLLANGKRLNRLTVDRNIRGLKVETVELTHADLKILNNSTSEEVLYFIHQLYISNAKET